MKYTLEQIHNLKDSELCEAISKAREPTITGTILGEYCRMSRLGCWIRLYDLSWKPINWLDPQNWTRLMDEVANDESTIDFVLGLGGDRSKRVFLMNEKYPTIRTSADSFGRAVCEAYLILEDK